jgi:hypothetical protein
MKTLLLIFALCIALVVGLLMIAPWEQAEIPAASETSSDSAKDICAGGPGSYAVSESDCRARNRPRAQ